MSAFVTPYISALVERQLAPKSASCAPFPDLALHKIEFPTLCYTFDDHHLFTCVSSPFAYLYTGVLLVFLLLITINYWYLHTKKSPYACYDGLLYILDLAWSWLVLFDVTSRHP
jgi:hypothetical protein